MYTEWSKKGDVHMYVMNALSSPLLIDTFLFFSYT